MLYHQIEFLFKKMHFIFLHCILLIFIKNTIAWRLGEELHWLPNLEWTTKNNWINENIPTLNSRILFPAEMKHSVGFPLTGEFILTGIDLPRDGSLLLPNDGSIRVRFKINLHNLIYYFFDF